MAAQVFTSEYGHIFGKIFGKTSVLNQPNAFYGACRPARLRARLPMPVRGVTGAAQAVPSTVRFSRLTSCGRRPPSGCSSLARLHRWCVCVCVCVRVCVFV